MRRLAAVCGALLLYLAPQTAIWAGSGTVWLDSLDLSLVRQEWGRAQAGRSVEGNPLKLHGRAFSRGVGTHAFSEINLELGQRAESFSAVVGVDDERTGLGSVIFQVFVDGRKVYDSGVMRGGAEPKPVFVDLKGARRMALIAEGSVDGIGHDHANWADALIRMTRMSRRFPRMVPSPVAAAPVPPIKVKRSKSPAIHAGKVIGASPGRPFLYLVPVTGKGPWEFSAQGLPAGLKIDTKSGMISGAIEREGEYAVRLEVRGPRGNAERRITISAGPRRLALTPPLGWNSWYCWGEEVDDRKVRDAADWMVKSGLAARGFAYVNIDDGWQGERGPDGEIRPNGKFPDMRALADYVHSEGLKLGIYSSPGPKTCAGFAGSFGHERQDALTYARWGVDLLKYDWCSCESPDLKAPYILMRRALDECGRDIVFSLCQYGMGAVWEWGREAGGNLWRTTWDITDVWRGMTAIGFSQDVPAPFAGPGGWNDPDMLMVGEIGGAWGEDARVTRLTGNEQITHVSLWALLAAPLLLSCDLARLDEWTLALVTNEEVLAVNQDPLGKSARMAAKEGTREVWAKPLADGGLAVGLFNRGRSSQTVTAAWEDLGITGKRRARDLWLRKDLGRFSGEFSRKIPAHGALLLKLSGA